MRWAPPITEDDLQGSPGSLLAVADLLARVEQRSASPGFLLNAMVGTRVSKPVKRRLDLFHALSGIPISALIDAALDLLLPGNDEIARHIGAHGSDTE